MDSYNKKRDLKKAFLIERSIHCWNKLFQKGRRYRQGCALHEKDCVRGGTWAPLLWAPILRSNIRDWSTREGVGDSLHPHHQMKGPQQQNYSLVPGRDGASQDTRQQGPDQEKAQGSHRDALGAELPEWLQTCKGASQLQLSEGCYLALEQVLRTTQVSPGLFPAPCMLFSQIPWDPWTLACFISSSSAHPHSDWWLPLSLLICVNLLQLAFWAFLLSAPLRCLATVPSSPDSRLVSGIALSALLWDATLTSMAQGSVR